MCRDGVRNLVRSMKATRRTSNMRISSKKKTREVWACCWVGQEILWQRTERRQKYSMAPPPWSLLIRPVFRNPRSLRPVVKSRARKTYPEWWRIKSAIVWTNWIYTTPWNMMGHTHKSWGSWLICGPLLIISERLYWLGEVPGDCKKANVTSVFNQGKEEPNKPESLTSVSEKVMK